MITLDLRKTDYRRYLEVRSQKDLSSYRLKPDKSNHQRILKEFPVNRTLLRNMVTDSPEDRHA